MTFLLFFVLLIFAALALTSNDSDERVGYGFLIFALSLFFFKGA